MSYRKKHFQFYQARPDLPSKILAEGLRQRQEKYQTNIRQRPEKYRTKIEQTRAFFRASAPVAAEEL